MTETAPSGAWLFAEAVQRLGITHVFTLVGDHLNDVLRALALHGLTIVDMRHESGVTHAADAWARIHRKPALALVTGGPGHTNALTGIATAFLAASPLIAVSGSRASNLAGKQAFQDIDQVSMARPVVKWAAEPPNAAQIPFFLGRAYAEANSGRKGPVHLTIPVDLFTQRASGPAPLPDAAPESQIAPDPRACEQTLEMLRTAESPVILAGSGAWWDGAQEELRRLVEITRVPLFTITMARGLVPDSHPLCFGYGDPALNGAVRQLFAHADAFLIAGKRIDYRLAMGSSRVIPAAARVAQIDIHEQELGANRRLDVALRASVRPALAMLAEMAKEREWPLTGWLAHARQVTKAWRANLDLSASDASTPLHPAAFYQELRRHLPPDVVYAWDGGDFVHWGRAILPAEGPGRWLRLGPLGTIGSALPISIAAQMAHPGRKTVMITGDGSFGFYLAEVDTAVRYGLPVIFIVGNDGGWGLERELQSAAFGGQTVACELRRSRYDDVVKAFGGDGETVETLAEVGPALGRALSSQVPYCLNVISRGARSPFTDWQLLGKRG